MRFCQKGMENDLYRLPSLRTPATRSIISLEFEYGGEVVKQLPESKVEGVYAHGAPLYAWGACDTTQPQSYPIRQSFISWHLRPLFNASSKSLRKRMLCLKVRSISLRIGLA